MDDTARLLVVTGASGYIGRELVGLAITSGWAVVALTRSPTGVDLPGLTEQPYDLLSDDVPPVPEDADLVIHLAARTDSDDVEDGREEAAAELLMSIARERGTKRFVYASTLSARSDAPSAYGRVKHAIQQGVLARGGTVVRLGLVCGGEEAAGLFARLTGLVKRSRIVPRLIPSPHVQPIFVRDACEALLRAGDEKHVGTSLAVAHSSPQRFDRFLAVVSRFRLSKRLWTVPIPVAPIRFALRLASRTGLFPGLSVARLDSLTDLQAVDTRPSLDRLGLRLIPVEQAVTRPSGRRRQLLVEGRAMLRYVGLRKHCTLAARHYVRAVETHQNGHAFDPAARGTRWPFLLSATERRARALESRNIVWRFDAAFAVVDAMDGRSIQSSGGASFIGTLASLLIAGGMEGLWRVLAPNVRIGRRT